MARRYDIRVDGHRFRFSYRPDTHTYRVTIGEDLHVGQAADLTAARDKVREIIRAALAGTAS